jgi:hypothetical protein
LALEREQMKGKREGKTIEKAEARPCGDEGAGGAEEGDASCAYWSQLQKPSESMG